VNTAAAGSVKNKAIFYGTRKLNAYPGFTKHISPLNPRPG